MEKRCLCLWAMRRWKSSRHEGEVSKHHGKAEKLKSHVA